MTVLCIVAHPDDEVLGAGGTLARHAAAGDDVHVRFLSNGVTSRHDEVDESVWAEIDRRKESAREAAEVLGVDSTSFHEFPDNAFDSVPLLDLVQTVESHVDELRPETVYTHHPGDLNVDHELTSRAVLTAARPLKDSPVKRVLAAEVLSSTEWSASRATNSFDPTVFVDVSDQLGRKLEALRTYEVELRNHPHPRTVENVQRNAELWGAKSGLGAAEAFELLREVR